MLCLLLILIVMYANARHRLPVGERIERAVYLQIRDRFPCSYLLDSSMLSESHKDLITEQEISQSQGNECGNSK